MWVEQFRRKYILTFYIMMLNQYLPLHQPMWAKQFRRKCTLTFPNRETGWQESVIVEWTSHMLDNCWRTFWKSEQKLNFNQSWRFFEFLEAPILAIIFHNCLNIKSIDQHIKLKSSTVCTLSIIEVSAKPFDSLAVITLKRWF
jgi:hypothetical protein